MFKEEPETFAQNEMENHLTGKENKTNAAATEAAKHNSNTLNTFIQNMPVLVCLSHLRWDFVYQRPQHLLSRFLPHTRVYFVEEPVFAEVQVPFMESSSRGENMSLLVPHLPHGLQPEQIIEAQRLLLDDFFEVQALDKPILWYYTPMALAFTDHLQAGLVVYDCMDELSAFKFASPIIKELEQKLFKKADLVFTGGQSLYEAKREQHPAIKAFPSSIDKKHFEKAKEALSAPADQAAIPEPRLGFYGVIDERFDIELLGAIAEARPDWQLVMIGPIVKIDPADLPQRPNIHYLGGKTYQELPAYLSGWQVALLPFAINESTAFISPTKTPEYLAAGKPVVSTPIRDVVRPYGDEGLVHIADTATAFVSAIELALKQREDENWKQKVQQFMQHMSWDQTWKDMVTLMATAFKAKEVAENKLKGGSSHV